MTDLPITTLFMLMSIDGKISTGEGDARDFDQDLPSSGAGAGLQQYYELEEQTDLASFNTGKVMAKIGWNDEKPAIMQTPVSLIIIDNKPHLTSRGVSNLCRRVKKLYLITTNQKHPARDSTEPNLEVIYIEGRIDFSGLFKHLKEVGIDRITVQSGGEMNALLLRHGLINYVSVVVAPILVGGKNTPTLIDGPSVIADNDLAFLKPLKLESANILKDSYLHLQYQIN